MLNNVILQGRLTQAPTLRTAGAGKVVAFTLACTKDNDHTDFVSCQAWNKTAELICNYLDKGSMVAITGRLNTRNYEDKNGNKVYITEVIANTVEFLDQRKGHTPTEQEQKEAAAPTVDKDEALRKLKELQAQLGI